jgi:hypothetical protein
MTADRQPLADQAATLYRAGHSTTCIADQIGRGWTSTRELIKAAGIVLRRRGTRCRPELHPRTARLEYAAGLRARYEAGATLHQLAAETGRSRTSIASLLHHVGTRMRPAGRRPKSTSR